MVTSHWRPLGSTRLVRRQRARTKCGQDPSLWSPPVGMGWTEQTGLELASVNNFSGFQSVRTVPDCASGRESESPIGERVGRGLWIGRFAFEG